MVGYNTLAAGYFVDAADDDYDYGTSYPVQLAIISHTYFWIFNGMKA